MSALFDVSEAMSGWVLGDGMRPWKYFIVHKQYLCSAEPANGEYCPVIARR
jgi:hypothetical protein